MSEDGRWTTWKKIRVSIALFILLNVIFIFVLTRLGIIGLFKVTSGSMEPTLQIGDVIFIDSQSIPDRFDIVALSDPNHPDDLPIVKRIVGMGGDLIEIRGGILLINGEEQYSRHIKGNRINWQDVRVKVPFDQVFLLGDNRNDSYDSLNFGTVSVDDLKGKLTYILWPPGRWGKVDNFEDN